MPASVAFEELLDEHLRVPSAPAPRNDVQPRVASAAAYGFFFPSPSASTLSPRAILLQADGSVTSAAPVRPGVYQPAADVTSRPAGSGRPEPRADAASFRRERLIS